jgi:hypothetical protein
MCLEIPGQFNQKMGLTICAKGDNAQNQSGRFKRHITDDVLPPLLNKLSSEAK